MRPPRPSSVADVVEEENMMCGLGKPGCFTVGRQSRSEPLGMEKGEQAPHQPWTAESINILYYGTGFHTYTARQMACTQT